MPALTLYGRATSSCTARLRIALALKRLPYTAVHLSRSQQLDPATRYAAVNPARTVPTLHVTDPDGPGSAPVLVTQSVAALAFLEEAFPDAPALLPGPTAASGQLAARARVRALVDLVASDIQPRQAVQTLRVLEETVQGTGTGTDSEATSAASRAWAHRFCVEGFAAYEALLGDGDVYSVGHAPTLADCCLVPMVWNATERWGVSLAPFPRLAVVYARLMALPAVAGAHARHQPDFADADK